VIDLTIRGGLVVDGTGALPRRADVGIDDGRVVAVGSVEDDARRIIDADGRVVAPGFIDLHTHYDAQLFWDPTASPSPLHGVTTVFGGNCGFSLAPAGPEHADYLLRMLARVEGMPLVALQSGIDWTWSSFGEWLGRLDGAVGVNAGFLVGHSTLRRAVMGEAADGPATEDQVTRLEDALHGALAEGAMGFSTSQAPTHNDGDGRPVPSRFADRSELECLATVVGDHPGTTVEMIVPGCLNGFTDDEVALLTSMSVRSGRPVNWNVLAATAANPDTLTHGFAGLCVLMEKPALKRLREAKPKATRSDLAPGQRWPFRFHDLRHFSVTTLIAAGVDVRTVAERHGHARATMTFDRYAHALPERDREAAGVLESVLTFD